MDRKVEMVAVDLLLLLIVGAVIAGTTSQTRQVTNNVVVTGDSVFTGDFQLYEDAGHTVVWVNEEWGEIGKGETKESTQKWGKNNASGVIYVKWTATMSIGLTLVIKRDDGSAGTVWAENAYILVSRDSKVWSEVCQVWKNWDFWMDLTVGNDAVDGVQSFTIVFSSSDTGE